LDAVERGKEMQRLRKAVGLRQRDVAELLGGLTPQAVSTWESGTAAPELHRLRKLDAAYKANGKVLRLYGVPVTSARREEVTRLEETVARLSLQVEWLLEHVEELTGERRPPLGGDAASRVAQ
jgi:transcriptional regulator with XRE-family HTH domain